MMSGVDSLSHDNIDLPDEAVLFSTKRIFGGFRPTEASSRQSPFGKSSMFCAVTPTLLMTCLKYLKKVEDKD